MPVRDEVWTERRCWQEMLVRDSVSRGPENPGSRVSWILGLTFSPLHNVHTCALEQREADSLDGEKTVKSTLSISISMSLGRGRQSPGPTEIDKKEHGESYGGTGVWMLQILVPLSTPWTVTFHIWHSVTLCCALEPTCIPNTVSVLPPGIGQCGCLVLGIISFGNSQT